MADDVALVAAHPGLRSAARTRPPREPWRAWSRFPLLARFIVFIALPAVAVVGGQWLHLRSALPEQGPPTRVVDGVQQPVQVVRDADGVPHVSASSVRDACFAIGYLHAQDRLWQLEIERRIASGRLSEVFGSASLKQDLWMRTLDLTTAARSAWNALGPDARASLTAYADGVNAWIDSQPALPPEFAAFGIRPGHWTEIDSLAWQKVFALNLAGNFDREVAFHLASRVMTGPQRETFFGPDSERVASAFAVPRAGAAAIARSSATDAREATLTALYLDHRALQAQLKIGGRFVGSNAWAVAGELAAGGHAILANDPHLGLQIPSLWYPATIEGGNLKTAGMTLVGLPLVIFGRNEHIAWAGTSLPADVQDVFFEQVDPHDASRYRVGDHWERFATRTEQIRIQPDFPSALREPLKPLVVELRDSRHGPVISDAVGGGLAQPMALQWTALAPGDTSYEAFYRLGFASDWGQFRASLQQLVAPTLNMLYADSAGHIGFAAAGRIPVRRSGDGSRPSPGQDASHDWIGAIPSDQMPSRFDPPEGFLVSANDEAPYRDSAWFISRDWAGPGRAMRIAQQLRAQAASGPLTAEQSARLQLDQVSLPAAALAARLVRIAPRDARERAAIERLRGWSGAMDADDEPAAIFQVWQRQLRRRLFMDALTAVGNAITRDPAGTGALQGLVDDLPLERLEDALFDGRGAWCELGGDRACTTLALDSLDAALDELTKDFGADMSAWRWGRIHHVAYEHMPFSRVKVLEPIFGRRLEAGGSPDTINVANAIADASNGYRQTFGAGFRQVFAMARDPAASVHQYMNSTGESGNVLSPHYADMVEPFQRGQLAPLAWNTTRDGPGSLRLLPSRAVAAASHGGPEGDAP